MTALLNPTRAALRGYAKRGRLAVGGLAAGSLVALALAGSRGAELATAQAGTAGHAAGALALITAAVLLAVAAWAVVPVLHSTRTAWRMPSLLVALFGGSVTLALAGMLLSAVAQGDGLDAASVLGLMFWSTIATTVAVVRAGWSGKGGWR